MATTKNLINSLNNAVPEALSGLCYTYPQLVYHTAYGVVLSPDYKYRKNKVSLVCGGGSGHEPFAADEGLMFELAQDEMECGMGVHGEVGYQRMKLRTASEVVTLMLKHICKDLSLTANDKVAVIINNFGALSQLEQAIVVYEVVNQLKHMDITPIRVYSGVLMTSLNSAGIHISVLKLTGKYMFTLITYLDAETMAPCWPGRSYNIPSVFMRTPFEEDELEEHETSPVPVVQTSSINSVMKSINEEISLSFPYMSYNYDKIYNETLFKNCLLAVSHVFTDSNTRNYLNELDRGCGDGDCGDTMHTFGNELVIYLESSCKYPQSALFQLANIMSCNVGGTTGALYCLFFTAGAKILPLLASDPNNLDTQCIWYRVFCSGLDCLKKYGKVKAGDRSMIDTLEAVRTIYENLLHERYEQTNPTDFYDKIIKAAWEGCNSTKNMIPKVGRASYTKQTQYLKKEDAGAYVAAMWIEAVARTIRDALYPNLLSLETMVLDHSNIKQNK